MVDPVGHRARCHECLRKKLARRHVVWGIGPSESGENVERPGFQLVTGEDDRPLAFQVAGKARER